MMTAHHSVPIRILDKTYQIKCDAAFVEELKEAAHYVDQEIRKIRESGKIIGLDRMAIITAVNTAHLLLNNQKQENKYIDLMAQRIRELQTKIEAVLAYQEEMEF